MGELLEIVQTSKKLLILRIQISLYNFDIIMWRAYLFMSFRFMFDHYKTPLFQEYGPCVPKL